MGDEDDVMVDFHSDIPYPRVLGRQLVKQALSVYCKHDIIAEWCHTCKHSNPASIKAVLTAENLAIAENLANWEKSVKR